MSIVLTERTYDQFSITMCYYQNRIFITLAAWLFVNLVLPMFLPAIILYAYSISQGGSDGFCTIFIKLMKCGMYVFSSFTLTFSLFEDYEKARQVVTPIHYLLILVMLIFLIFMFLTSNPLFEFYNSVKFADIALPYTLIFALLVIVNSYLKFKILNNRLL